MSKALCCDQCETTLPLNARGEHDGGEDSAWLVLELANERFDLCTRSCLTAFVEREEVIAAQDAWAETITGIARVVRGDDDSDREA